MPPIDKNNIQDHKMMLKILSTAHVEALKKLDKIREWQKIMCKILESLTKHIRICKKIKRN